MAHAGQAGIRGTTGTRVQHAPGRRADQEPLRTADVRMIASPAIALVAAEKVAKAHGLSCLILGDAIEGEAREVGKVMAGVASSNGYGANERYELLRWMGLAMSTPPVISQERQTSIREPGHSTSPAVEG